MVSCKFNCNVVSFIKNDFRVNPTPQTLYFLSFQIPPDDFSQALHYVTRSTKWRLYNLSFNKILHAFFHLVVIAAIWSVFFYLHEHHSLRFELGAFLFVLITVSAMIFIHVIVNCIRRRVSKRVTIIL